MNNNKLLLEDCLEDTPQTRAMIDLYEKDAQMMKKFSKALLNSCQKVSNAQSTMISATQELSYYLRLYSQQNFPLDTSSTSDPIQLSNSDESTSTGIASSLNQFATYIDEVSTCLQVFVTQLNDTMLYPFNKLIDDEFDNFQSLSNMYQITSNDEELAKQRILRLPVRKENELQRQKLNEEYSVFKKKFHQTSMNYYAFLNSLQYKRQYMLTEPMLSFMQSIKLLFKLGSDVFVNQQNESIITTSVSVGTRANQQSIDKFLNQTCDQICKVKENLKEDTKKTNQLIELLQQDETIYEIEKLNIDAKIDKSSMQKDGYLNLRSKFPFISKWDRAYYFIQNGCLMHQQKNEVAGSVFMELKSDMIVSHSDIDERPYSFQIASQFPKRATYFQANSNVDREEWIVSLQNAITDDNRSKLLNYMSNQSNRNKINSDRSSLGSNDSDMLNISATNIKFDLNELIQADLPSPNNLSASKLNTISQNELDSKSEYRVRFLGSMPALRIAERKNELINETIRSVMAARAELNLFKLNEFNLAIDHKSIRLYKIISTSNDVNKLKTNPDGDGIIIDDVPRAKFRISNLAVWNSHKDNQRLFGLVVKEPNQSLKFTCYVFESDQDSNVICEAINKANQVAFQLLVEQNKADHIKLIKEKEKAILLENISNLPDKQQNENNVDESVARTKASSSSDLDTEAHKDLLNAVSIVMNSKNPNFFALDKDVLENYAKSEPDKDTKLNLNKEDDINPETENKPEEESEA